MRPHDSGVDASIIDKTNIPRHRGLRTIPVLKRVLAVPDDIVSVNDVLLAYARSFVLVG